MDKKLEISLTVIEPQKWSLNYKAKEIKTMKRHVPFTRVSVDPEIQRMRDILANGGYVDDDGSLYNDREAAAMNIDSGVKAKTVPKTVVSFFDYKSDEKKIVVFYGDSEEPIVNSSRTTEVGEEYKEKENKAMKKIYVPFTSVSVDPEIQRMRDMFTSGENLVIDDDGTIGRAGDPQFEDAGNGTKAKTVPKAIVSIPENGGSVRDFINEIRGEDAEEDGAEPEATAEPEAANNMKKPGAVPKSILSTRSVSDLINEMRGGEDSEIEAEEDDVESYIDEPQVSANPKLVPKTVVSANQWYEKNPDLLTAEKAAMYDFQGKKARFCILKDGRACWMVHCHPSIAGRDKRYCRAYDIALIYDNDHPQARYGSSVKAYLLNPTIDQLQDIVNRTSGVSPKNIPHLLRDGNGELYLCSADTRDVSTSLDSKGGITSAATSLRFALRWINIFELGLIDPVTWGKFQKHGEI